MKKWEFNMLRSILSDLENCPKPVMKNGVNTQYLTIEQQKQINEIMAELREISKLIPELNGITNKIYYSNFPDIIAVLRGVLSRGDEEIKVEAEILYLISKWKSSSNEEKSEQILNQIERKLSKVSMKLISFFRIENIKENSKEQLFQLEEALRYDINERIYNIGPDEEQNSDLDRAYDYRRISQMYRFMKRAKGEVYAKNRILEFMEKSNDRVLHDFIPTLKKLDTEFFETYIDYLKASGNYLISIHTKGISKDTKKEFEHILDFAQKVKDTMLFEKRNNPFFASKEYKFAMGKPNIVREKDGIIIYIQTKPYEKAFSYRIPITKKEEQMSSREKAAIIEKILGLENGKIYLHGLQTVYGNSRQTSISQAKENIEALDEILSKVDPAILKAYEQMQTDLPRILRGNEELLRALNREDIKEQLKNFVDITTQRVREDIRNRAKERKRQSFNDEVRNYIDVILLTIKEAVNPNLSPARKALSFKNMLLKEIQKYVPSCTLEDLLPLDYDSLYSKFFRIEAKYNQERFNAIVEENETEKIDDTLLFDDSKTRKEHQRNLYEENVAQIVERIKKGNPQLTHKEVIEQAKAIITKFIRHKNLAYEINEKEDIQSEKDLAVLLLDFKNQTACGNIVYNVSEEELEQNDTSKIGNYMLVANSMQIARFTENAPKIKIDIVSGRFGRIKAAIRNFAIPEEQLYQGIKKDTEKGLPWEEEKELFMEELKLGISREIRLAKKELRRRISGFSKKKVVYKKEKREKTAKKSVDIR